MVMITIALHNDLTICSARPLSLGYMNHLFNCHGHRHLAVRFDGDSLFTNEYVAAVMTKQPMTLTSDSDKITYLLIQPGLNSLLNKHHIDIIITYIHHVHK
jgi:hypothetical protein